MTEFRRYPKADDEREQADRGARALWAVRVLDAWALRNSGFAFKTDTAPNDCDTREPWICGVAMSRKHRHLARRGVSPGAARISAAEALLAADPTLGEP